ncbi:FtsJ-like methyltransferase-domain-containing protein [Delphinella strobiligena]|nr:FtsJ-like methyltransferase-domain-containing protein [Delphinella strobiligena]
MLCSRQLQRHISSQHVIITSLTRLWPVQRVSSCALKSSTLPRTTARLGIRSASSSSTRWKTRQTNDHFAKEARVAGLKSRAAYKLLELDSKHRLFKKGGTVVDLGYAPGSWSQVAVNRTSPGGRVVGIDIIPAQPPRGASSIQGNFLSPEVQAEVRDYVQDYWKGRARKRGVLARRVGDEEEEEADGVTEDEVDNLSRGIVDLGREATTPRSSTEELLAASDMERESMEEGRELSQAEKDELDGRVVDVVLSDLSAPWEQITGTWIRSVNNPYRRMMNTSGMPFRDHAGSMDLCNAALTFCYSTLHTGGHFLCKFYQGGEDKAFEMRLRKLFEKVHREKPESSRPESKEAYFVALRRKPNVDRNLVFPDEY